MSRRLRAPKGVLARVLPEKRVSIETEAETHILHIGTGAQLSLWAVALLILGWLVAATATVSVDRIAPQTGPQRLAVSQDAFEARLRSLTKERDVRAAEALSAQVRFQTAMDEIGRNQTALLRSIEARRELEAALTVTRAKLRDAVDQRNAIAAANDRLVAEMSAAASSLRATASGKDLSDTLSIVTGALAEAVVARDAAASARETLTADLAETEKRLTIANLEHDRMLDDVRTALSEATGPIEDLLRQTGLDIDSTIALMRRDYSGQGGPLAGVSTRSYEGDIASVDRFDELMLDIDRMNFLRIAIGKVPYAVPVTATHRFTSGFGYRRDPKGRGRRMHEGVDFAAPKGTPIYATADGVVVSATTESGYGKTVRIRHAFGFETVYAHLSRLEVESGEQVSRGDHIGGMGSTGRSTGVHLHYEVHLNGRPVNPMTYVEAARNVF